MPATMMKERAQPFGEYPGSMIREAVRSAKPVREQWRRIVGDAAGSRRLPELHKARDEYRAFLESHIRLLEVLRSMAVLHTSDASSHDVEELDEVLTRLQQHFDELFPQWDTLEDFYRIAVEVVSIPAERLHSIAAKNTPPQSWLDETIDPFS